MIVVTHDTTALTDLALAAYGRALEPKSLAIMPVGHTTYRISKASKAALDWFAKHL